MGKLLDMADKYDSIQDLPKLADENDVYDDEEDTLIMRRPLLNRYPGVGIIMALAVSLVFWCTLAYFSAGVK